MAVAFRRLIALILLACLAAPAPAAEPVTADAAQTRLKAMEARLKAAKAARDLTAEASVRLDYARLVEEVAGPDHPKLAAALNLLAGTYRDQGRLDLALPHLERALAIREKALGPEHPETATLINNLAMVNEHLGRYDQALALLLRAQAIREKTLGADSLEYAGSLNNLAVLHLKAGRWGESLPLAERAQALVEKRNGPDDPLTATSLNNLASIQEKMGLYEKALPLYERALAIREQRFGPDHPETAASVNNLAGLYRHMGLFDKSVPLMERALAMNEKALGPEHPTVAMSCNNLAELYKVVGRYDQALPLYQRALAIAEKSLGPDHEVTAASLNNLAGMYYALGSPERVEPLLLRALAIREKRFGPDHPEVAEALNNLAMHYRKQKQYARALPLQERATAIKRRSAGDDHPVTGTALGNLAGLYDEANRPDEALKLLDQSLAITEKALGPDHPNVAMALANLATHYRRLGDHARALPLYQRALRIATQAAYPELSREMQGHLRRTHAGLKQPDLAIFFGKQAVNTIQAMRGQSLGLAKDLQQSLLKSNAEHYRALADLLIEAGRLAEAQQVLAMLKEEEFFEFIRRDGRADPRATRVSWTPAEAGFAAEFERIGDAAAGLSTEKRALDLRARLGLSDTERTRLAALRDQLAELGHQGGKLLENLARQLPAAQRRLADEEKRNQDRLAAGLREQLAGLGEDAALLHYLVLGDRVRIMLTTRGKLIARESALAEGELFRQLVDFRLAIQDPDGQPLALARKLYDQLVAPVAADLEAANARTLLLSLDGALRYIPFAALHDGQRYLVERYALSLHTAAAGQAVAAPQAHWQLAGFGLTRAIGDYSALPGVANELRGIVGPQGIAGQAQFDQDFTAEALRKALASQYSVVHLASHFLFTPGNEADSFLLLGDGNRLSLRELREGEYGFERLDLLTLSACETAMFGGREADGREVEGFGALAQRKGAKGVLATLWPIADASTAQLMQTFYRARERQGLSKSEALRQAQLGLLNGPAAQGYGHPFFWAAFILMGNGR
jgi:CHAT domain-containing protein/tetratricopeptide (TPR) repeat protein